MTGENWSNLIFLNLTEFDQRVPLLAVFHVSKIHLPAFQAFLLLAAFVSTLELTCKTSKNMYFKKASDMYTYYCV